MNRRGLLAMAMGVSALAVGGSNGLAHADMGTPAADGTPSAMPVGGTAAAFMTITNNGAADDRFVSAKTDVDRVTEIHEMKDVKGVMEMTPLPDGLPIPAGETVALKPGGFHVMLLGLKHDLVAGQNYQLMLTFEKAGVIEVTVPIYATPDAFEAADKIDPVTVGDLQIEGIWSRHAPAMLDASATPSH